MKSEIKIPTLLGLGVLILGLVAGIFLVTTSQILKSQAGQSATPKNVTVTNIAAEHVSIYWQTEQPAPGFVQAGPSATLGLTFVDDRDTKAPAPHKIHFVTLTNLTPDTTYHYKINSGSETYPKSETLTFKTAPSVTQGNLQPVIGSVISPELQPVSEAIVTLEIPGAQTLSAVTKVAGNFVLPLSEIYNRQLTEGFQIEKANINAQLTVTDFINQSKITLELPMAGTLPPVTLGKDLDLSQKPASPAAEMLRYDLNDDGVVNTLDRSIILQNRGKNPKNTKTDLNGDNVVDQTDLTLLEKYIPNIIPQ